MFASSKHTPFFTLSRVAGNFCNGGIGYRNGFNGQELNDEVAGAADMQQYFEKIKHIYGSSRLGIYESNTSIAWRSAYDANNDNQLSESEYNVGNANNTAFLFANLSGYRGKIRYEMSNHLGNVLTVVSDKKVALCSNGTFVSYAAEVISATDYSPFGAPLAGRTFSSYRYGFNGKENDNETYGEGNALDFGARIYDSRLGKWMSCDKLQAKHPDESTYIFAGNSPIKFVDFDGNDYGLEIDHKAGTIIIVANIYTINKISHDQALSAVADINKLKKTATIDGKEYRISFKIEADPDGYGKFPAHGADQIGNNYYGTRGSVSFNSEGKAVGGISDGMSISMNNIAFQKVLGDGSTTTDYHNAGNNPDLVSHEILHLLGLDDKGGEYYSPTGRMNYSASPPNFNLKPISNEDIYNIIKYAIENDNKQRIEGNPVVNVKETGEGSIKDKKDTIKIIDTP